MNFLPERRNGRDVLVGVRPEHLDLASDGLAAQVVVVEPTGADTQIFCKVDGVTSPPVVRESKLSVQAKRTPQATAHFSFRSSEREQARINSSSKGGA